MDGVPDSREEQPKGSTGDTITSPSNHGNPNERVIPVDHVITKNSEGSVGTGMFLGAFSQVDGKHKFEKPSSMNWAFCV